MTSKMLLLNGPRGCGKSQAEMHLRRSSCFDFELAPCKEHLYLLTYQMFGLTENEFFNIYHNRALKEVPLPEFKVTRIAYDRLRGVLPNIPEAYADLMELSIRQAMIFVSEVVCKPIFGRDYFGVIRAEGLRDPGNYLDDSCGFAEELPPLIDKLGQDNILLIRIYGRGEFSGDSRGYIPDGVIENTLDVYNTGGEQEYLEQIKSIAQMFYGGDSLKLRIDSIKDNLRADAILDELENWKVNDRGGDVYPKDLVEVRFVNGTTDTGPAAKFDWESFGKVNSIYKYRVLEVSTQ